MNHASQYVTAYTAALHGLKSLPVHITATATDGAPGLTIVGLPDAAARETRVRVLSAISRLGIELLTQFHVLVCSPGGSSCHFDLAVACAVLAAAGPVPSDRLASTLLVGELSLDGRIRAVRGLIPLVTGRALEEAIVPAENGTEAGLCVLPRTAGSLAEVVAFLRGNGPLPIATARLFIPQPEPAPVPSMLAEQADAIIATGKRRILLVGAPGSGKTTLARAIRDRLAPLSEQEAIENAATYSAAGLLSQDVKTWRQRPFRAPHHTVSEAGLVGGGAAMRPGEVTLANHGVLLLDELTEFRRSAIEAVSSALRRGCVTSVRNAEHYSLPATPARVIGATNPCPCGYAGHSRLPCRCSAAQIERYKERFYPELFELTVELSPSVQNYLQSRSQIDLAAR